MKTVAGGRVELQSIRVIVCDTVDTLIWGLGGGGVDRQAFPCCRKLLNKKFLENGAGMDSEFRGPT